MSGAEQKSIDLCTKFALMDIAKIKAKIYPDILILDEILDSSIDDFGIEKLMEIVKYKQETDNIKIFIISHKKEINEINFGNVYKVFKKNGFSYLDQQESFMIDDNNINYTNPCLNWEKKRTDEFFEKKNA